MEIIALKKVVGAVLPLLEKDTRQSHPKSPSQVLMQSVTRLGISLPCCSLEDVRQEENSKFGSRHCQPSSIKFRMKSFIQDSLLQFHKEH